MKSDLVKKLLGIAFIFCFSFMISCSKEDVKKEPDLEEIEVIEEVEETEVIIICEKDDSNFDGTICCVSGPEIASASERLQYEYSSNIPNFSITWEVTSGSIALVEGQNTHIATFEFGKDFNGGTIRAFGESKVVCAEPFNVSSF